MKVWLDDIRPAPKGWIRTKTVNETIELLRTGEVTELDLDHNLGGDGETGTGFDVLEWIKDQVERNNFKPPDMKVHTNSLFYAGKMQIGINDIKRLVAARGRT